MAGQLIFDFTAPPSYHAHDFVVTSSNQNAVNMVADLTAWPTPVMILCGPSGVGKTHLLNLWQTQNNAAVLPPMALNTEFNPFASPNPVLAIDNADSITGNAAAERALLHLYNKTLQQKHRLLLTAKTHPSTWHILIPDLASRLRIATIVQMPEPDDVMMQTLYHKMFQDRQLTVSTDVIEWLCVHLPRAASTAQQVVVTLDQAALAAGRPISIWLARKVLNVEEND